jgi:hypothetical protein
MNTLVFQIVLKQWDKSQRHDAFQTAIADAADAFPIQSKPEFMLFDTPCMLDQQALDFTIAPLDVTTAEHINGKGAGRTIKQALLADGSAKLDRFIISRAGDVFHLSYEDEEGIISDIGNLDNGWIQAKYQWRYRIEKNHEIFWQYEEVTLNTALVQQVAVDIFLSHPPAMIFSGV